ncbi:hypothetical protein MKW98_002432 [Papaver atlanticum]|uniref:Uncharacterized protein n=1 Tax=Papaver atlanticum TaxID=357466 RepID=A0AAD4SAG7_9MAGN|nr:hypothetical protein MKW98_002432 [Papaver atlanticum]
MHHLNPIRANEKMQAYIGVAVMGAAVQQPNLSTKCSSTFVPNLSVQHTMDRFPSQHSLYQMGKMSAGLRSIRLRNDSTSACFHNNLYMCHPQFQYQVNPLFTANFSGGYLVYQLGMTTARKLGLVISGGYFVYQLGMTMSRNCRAQKIMGYSSG